jgi:hypothetical protein
MVLVALRKTHCDTTLQGDHSRSLEFAPPQSNASNQSSQSVPIIECDDVSCYNNPFTIDTIEIQRLDKPARLPQV